MSNNNENNMKIPESVSNTVESIKSAVSSAGRSISEKASEISASVSSSLSQFSSKSVTEGSTEFLESNSIIAKFAFVILILIAFLFLCNLGIVLIGYFSSPPTNPYLISGTANGASELVIKQDPKAKDSVQIIRSSNGDSGIEFTWSFWLFVLNMDTNNNSTKYRHVFNKGNLPTSENDGVATVNNAPGVYLSKTTDTNQLNLHVVMNTVDVSNINQIVDIPNIPIEKWFHCAIRLKNKVIDVYINGTVTARIILNSVPKQNYYNVNICSNGGFNGNIADLHYYNRALSVFEINNTVVWGRNKNISVGTGGGQSDGTGFPYYLSNSWYSN
jgi:hypothetical protein